MNTQQLIPFDFEEQSVRAYCDESGNSWFVARDVALALGYTNPQKAVQDHCKTMKLLKSSDSLLLGVPPRGLLVIPDSDVWRLILRSRLPKAEVLEKWLMEEVLPTLRKTGTYTVPKQARRKVLPEGVPAEALLLRPTVRQRLWQDALQTARLDNAGTEAAQEWFVRLCQLMTCDSTKAEDEGLINAFMDQCLESSRGRTTSFSKIYAALQLWWDKNGIGPVPGTRRASEMVGVRFHRHKSSVSTFRNCALRT